MNEFEQAGLIFLDKSWNRLKIVIDGEFYFVKLKDIHYALNKTDFRANIFKLPKQPSADSSQGQKPI